MNEYIEKDLRDRIKLKQSINVYNQHVVKSLLQGESKIIGKVRLVLNLKPLTWFVNKNSASFWLRKKKMKNKKYFDTNIGMILVKIATKLMRII